MESGVTGEGVDPRQKAWDEFVRKANEFIDSGELDEQEVIYKLDLGREFAEAREAVLSGAEDWVDHLKKGGFRDRPGHPMDWRMTSDLKQWISDSPDDALEAFQTLWEQGEQTVSERIRAFNRLLPQNPEIRGKEGTRIRIISTLLMGLGAKDHPPFATETFKEAYKQTGYEPPGRGADEADLYRHALVFLDQLIEDAQANRLHLRHRLDAQSIVWHWRRLPDELPELGLPSADRTNWEEPESAKSDALQIKPCDIQELAQELLLTPHFIQEINTLLKDKRQVIFQGPPGTGKTYVAQALARCLAGSKERVTLVQFHPSYAYEDFVRGFRPALLNGQAGFTLQDGPLLQAAEKARNEKESNHFLIIDEINRGNLAKVFGELYFLLEYRDKSIRMQYQQEEEDDFSLPVNLYIIGTMNTADRSIALVDLALRRRFYFVEFHPDKDPVKSVLRKWLGEESKLVWVADVVDEANELLKDDRHAAIGPSYFMKNNLREEDVPRIWKHSVLPYIEERLFGDDNRIEEFDLRKLKAKAEQTRRQRQQTRQSGDDANGDADSMNNEANQPSGVSGQQTDPSNDQ